MSDQAKLPESGYFIEKVYANRLGLIVRESEKNGDEAELFFQWDWRRIEESRFEVTVGLLLEPTRDRSEQVEVSIIGLFRQGSGKTEVPFGDFVRYHAPAILMPFVREAVGSLTGKGFYPARYLPVFNVQQLMDRQDPTKATGAKQLQNMVAVEKAAKSRGSKAHRRTPSEK